MIHVCFLLVKTVAFLYFCIVKHKKCGIAQLFVMHNTSKE